MSLEWQAGLMVSAVAECWLCEQVWCVGVRGRSSQEVGFATCVGFPEGREQGGSSNWVPD